MSTGRELTFDDVLRYAGQEATRPPPGSEASPSPGSSGERGGCGTGSCGCGGGAPAEPPAPDIPPPTHWDFEEVAGGSTKQPEETPFSTSR